MPHITVEYTDNIDREANIPLLLEQINKTIARHGDVFPIGGLRTRAIRLTDYVIADNMENDAFVQVTMKIGPGRSEKVKKQVTGEMFDMMEAHFSTFFKERYMAL